MILTLLLVFLAAWAGMVIHAVLRTIEHHTDHFSAVELAGCLAPGPRAGGEVATRRSRPFHPSARAAGKQDRAPLFRLNPGLLA